MPAKKVTPKSADTVATKPTPIAKKSSSSRSKHVVRGFATANRAVLKQVHPNLCMSSAAGEVFNNIANHVVDLLVTQSAQLCKQSKRGGLTLTPKHVELAVRLAFPSDLAKHAVMEATKATTKLAASV